MDAGGQTAEKMMVCKRIHPLSFLTLKNPQAFIFNIYSQLGVNRVPGMWDG